MEVAASELGVSEHRPLTVTGGLTFGGGPLNSQWATLDDPAVMDAMMREEFCGRRGQVDGHGALRVAS